jgi:Phospholipase_D-nuclease N-terminal
MILSFFTGPNAELYFLGWLIGGAFWLWMIVDCVTHEKNDKDERLIWLLVVLLASLPGALIYFFLRKIHRPENVLPIETYFKEKVGPPESESN